MPLQTDLLKGPFAFIDAILGGVAGDDNVVAYSSLQSVGWAGYAYKSIYGSKATGPKSKYKGTKQDILWWAIAYITLLSYLTGNSNGGEQFTSAAESWRTANILLGTAVVDPRDWSGMPAAEYDARNAEQMARVLELRDLDLRAAARIAKELDELKMTQMHFTYEISILLILVLVTAQLEATGNPVAARTIQWTAAISGSAAASLKFLHMSDLSSTNNAPSIDKKTAKYKEIASAAQTMLDRLGGPVPKVKGPDQAKSFVPEFVGPTRVESGAGLGGFTEVEPFAAAPTEVSGDTSVSHSPEEQSAPLPAGTASIGGVESFVNASPAEPSEAETPETEATPAYTMPTASQAMSRASQASTQAAKFSQEASTHVNLANQALGTVQQMGSMGQSGSATPAELASEESPAEEAPAEEASVEEGVLAQDVEGAAAGTTDGERAPVDVVADRTEQAPEPSPVERMV